MSTATPEDLLATTQALAERAGPHAAFWDDLADLAERCGSLTPQGRVNEFAQVVDRHHGPAAAAAAWSALSPAPRRP